MERIKPLLKYVVLGVLLFVLYYIFKPVPAPSPVVSKKGNSKSVTPTDFGLGTTDSPELPDDGHPWFSDEQLKIIDAEKKRAGNFNLDTISWGDFAANADSKFGTDKNSRGRVTAAFKGLGIQATGKGCWILQDVIETLFSKIHPDYDNHWDIPQNYYLNKTA